MSNYEWLSQGESIIYEAAANKQWNVKGINLPGNKGGQLILTDKHLVFQAHAINLGTKIDKIPLRNITSVDKGFHPLTPTPNMIKVETKLGEKYMFVVTGKDMETWLEVIPKAVKECADVPKNDDTIIKDNIYKCQNCAYSSNKSFRFCPECGTEYVEAVNRCKNCGANISDEMKFCPNCGASTFVEHNCPNCGTEYKEGQKFCLECGQALLQLN